MKLKTVIQITCYCIFTLAHFGVSAEPPPPQFVQFSPSATMGALYYPDPKEFPNPSVATLAMHRDSNFMSHLSTKEMPKRGIVAMGMNPRCNNNEALCTPWENNALDVKQGVEYLRNLPGIETVILIAHSGGGPTMAFYQAIAENGNSLCQAPERLIKCPDNIRDLSPADGIIFWDAHLGNGINAVRSLNPAVMNDEEILNDNAELLIDPKLNPFNQENGYNPDGITSYSDEFKSSYFKAQSVRMNKLIDIALERMERIETGTYRYPDDDVFIVPQGNGNRLFMLDLSIDNSSINPQKLVRNDGTIESCCIIDSVRTALESPNIAQKFWDGSFFLTLQSFLSVRGIRSKHAMSQIDWCSSNNSTPCNLKNVSIPILVVAMGGHYFIRDSEIIHQMAASKDKDFIVIEGANHGGTACKECMPTNQPYDGRYDNAVKNNFDYLAKWIKERF